MTKENHTVQENRVRRKKQEERRVGALKSLSCQMMVANNEKDSNLHDQGSGDIQ